MVNATPESLTDWSAGEMAAAVARGDIASAELVEAHIARIERVNPILNALVVECFTEARAAALRADAARVGGAALGPLHGVPVTIKECLDVAATPSTFGLPWRATHLAASDDRYVAQWRAAGAIVLGKSNVAQLLLYFESDNPLYGRSNNPWNLARSCGGSSGGEGALIAARASPLGMATDIGGSARIPAAFCGVAGFKPTNGRTPDPGRYSVPIGQRAIVSQLGVLARRVADLDLGLATLNAANNEPRSAWPDWRAVDVSTLRVGTYHDDGTMKVAPAVARAVRDASALLRRNGVAMVEWTPPAVPEAVHLYFALLSGDRGRGFRRALRDSRADPRAKTLMRLAALPRSMHALARGLLGALGQTTLAEFIGHFGFGKVSQYWDLVEAQIDYQERFAAALTKDGIDALLGPACAVPAYTHGAANDLGTAGGYALLWNLLGYPAGVLPLTRVRYAEQVGRNASRDRVEQAALKVEKDSVGLPVGVQVIAKPWREDIALALMAAIEKEARGLADYPERPPI